MMAFLAGRLCHFIYRALTTYIRMVPYSCCDTGCNGGGMLGTLSKLFERLKGALKPPKKEKPLEPGDPVVVKGDKAGHVLTFLGRRQGMAWVSPNGEKPGKLVLLDEIKAAHQR